MSRSEILLRCREITHRWGGLVAVDRATQARHPKPSAAWLGGIARANALDATAQS